MTEIGCWSSFEAEAIAGRIAYSTELKDLVSQARYITEAVSENLKLKKDLFETLDKETPDSVILASTTSFFDINEIAERVIGTHWFHPPQITSCVEVIPSAHTNKKVIEETFSLLISVGKAPTLCR